MQKNPLPPVLIVARAVLASMVIYGPLLLLLALAYAPLHRFNLAVLAFVPLAGAWLVLCLLLGYLLAILAAANSRGTPGAVGGLFLSVGIYLSPILFSAQPVSGNWRWVLWLNPVTALVLGYQQVLCWATGRLPACGWWACCGSWGWRWCSMWWWRAAMTNWCKLAMTRRHKTTTTPCSR